MPNYKHIDWTKSPAHIRLLSQFNKPHSRKRVVQYEYLTHDLKEDTDHAIQRFVDNEMLTQPTLGEIIKALYNKPPIEEILRKNNLRAVGDKSQLVARLVEQAPEAAQLMVGEHDLLVCSADALAFLEVHEQEQREAEKVAKEQAFSALLNSDGKQAYKIYTDYHRTYGNPEMYGGGSYYAEEMEVILNNEPELLKHLSERDKKYLRAATCMPKLWREEASSKWLPEDFSTIYEDGEVASNLLAKYAEIQHRIGDAAKTDKFQILFDLYDVDSCDICRKFDAQILAVRELPEFPDVRCSSRKGCQCSIQHHWESQYGYSEDEGDSDDEENSEGASNRRGISVDFADILELDSLEEFISERVHEYIKENIEIALDPLSKLRSLKQMLEEELITTEEYEATKQRILLRI